MRDSAPEDIHVLHVDDEPSLTEIVSEFLEDIHDKMVVATETSARDALDRLFSSDEEFDCIVSDYEMPGMNGQEFLEAVREKRPNLPFILFTGKGSEEIASQAISAGVTDYLRKGTGTDQYQLLANQIENAVNRWRTQYRLDWIREQTDVLLEDSPVMITVSIGGECTFINQAGVELLGAEGRESIIGRKFLDLIQPIGPGKEDEEIFLPEGNVSDGVTNLERQLTTVDGVTKFVEVTARPIVFGGEDAILAIVKDITDRKQREKELRKREQQYRSVAENFPRGMVLLFDEELRYTVAKGQGLSEVGLDSYNLEGRTIYQGLPDQLRELFEPRYHRALNGEEDVFELEYDDHVFRVHTVPIRDKDGEVFAGMQIAPDITSERQQTEKLKNQNDKLKEFSSVISHDLRNPITTARGHLKMAEQKDDLSKLEDIEESLDRMEALIEDVLSLARSGLTIDDMEPVSLRSITRKAWSQVKSNGTDIEIGGEIVIEADGNRLRELLGNLFRNTIEHAETERRIRVGKCYDGFYIEDDGIGIPEDDREKIFETGHSTSEEGTGLGLAIVKQIAEAHGWTIDVSESSTGGTRFDFTNVTILEA